MKQFRVGRLGTGTATGYGGRARGPAVVPAQAKNVYTFETVPKLFMHKDDVGEEHTGLLSDPESLTEPERGCSTWCRKNSILVGVICAAVTGVAVCGALLICTYLLTGMVEHGLYARLDPIVQHMEPAVADARTLISNLARAESRLEAQINHTYNKVVDSVPAIQHTNAMLEHSQSILSSVALATAHPRLHIDIDGAPG